MAERSATAPARQACAAAPLVSSVTLNAATGLLRPFSSTFPFQSLKYLVEATTAAGLRAPANQLGSALFEPRFAQAIEEVIETGLVLVQSL